jgi:hypothetical protein
MAINRSNIAKELIPGLNSVFGLNYRNVDNEHGPLFEKENSVRSFEEETMFALFGTAPTKAEGASVTYDEARETYTARYVHETIALAFAVTEEALEDNLYDTFAKVRAKALGRAMANTKQEKAANIFNNAFNASFTGGDGATLVSSTHSTIAGNQSNTGGAVDVSETTLETALIAIDNYRDERNILLAAKAVSLHIPRNLQFTVQRILGSELGTTVAHVDANGADDATSSVIAATNKNDINAIRNLGFFPGGVHVNRRFTDTNAWFIRTDVTDGTKYFERKKLATATEGDFDTGNGKYKARERYSFGWSDWRQWYGASGSS